MASFARMGEEIPVAPAPKVWQQEDWAEGLEKAIERGANHLISLQAEQGYWQGELEADTTLESDYIYYLFVLGKAEPGRIAKLANYVRRRQLPELRTALERCMERALRGPGKHHQRKRMVRPDVKSL